MLESSNPFSVAPKPPTLPVQVSIVGDPRSQEVREHLFNLVVLDRLVADFIRDFREVGFSEEEVSAFVEGAATLTDEEAKNALSMPWEIRRRYLAAALQDVRAGASAASGIVSEMHQIAQENGFRLGYHASDANIERRTNQMTKTEEWVVDGTDMDARDGMKMAYYSLDLAHVYGKKAAKNVYLVRAQVSGTGAHKVDNNDAWGRATSLPIVAKVDISLGDINELIDREYSDVVARGQAQDFSRPIAEEEKRAA